MNLRSISRLGQGRDGAARTTASCRIQAASSLNIVQQMKQAALDIPTLTLTWTAEFLLPQMDHGFLRQVLPRGFIPSDARCQTSQQFLSVIFLENHKSIPWVRFHTICFSFGLMLLAMPALTTNLPLMGCLNGARDLRLGGANRLQGVRFLSSAERPICASACAGGRE